MVNMSPTAVGLSENPGVPTRMGGPGATDDLDQAHLTQAWPAVGDDPGARLTGSYIYHQRPGRVSPAAQDPALQDRLLDYCRDLSGVALA